MNHHEEEVFEAPDGVPEGLWVALRAYVSDPDWLPPQGTPGLRAMVKLETTPTPRDLEWIDDQQALFTRASGVLERLTQTAPMPTSEEVMDGGNVEYPDWVGTPWAETLMHPWSQDLENAIEQAEDYVREKTGTKA